MHPDVPVRRKIVARRLLRAHPSSPNQAHAKQLRHGFEMLKAKGFLTVSDMCLIGVTNKEATSFWPRPVSLKTDKHNKTRIIKDAQIGSNVWDLELTFHRGGQRMVNWVDPGICARRIKKLTIDHFGGSSLGVIAQCVNLKTIELKCSSITSIPNLPSLTSICVTTCPSFDNFDFRLCERLRTLKIANYYSDLKFSQTKCVLPLGLCEFEVVGYSLDISNLPTSLATIIMENCGLTTLLCLSPLSKLECLNVSRNSNLRDLGSLPASLIELDMSNCENLNDDAMGTLPWLPCLRELRIKYCAISNIFFVKRCPNLDSLDVSFCLRLSSLNLKYPPRRLPKVSTFDPKERERIFDACYVPYIFKRNDFTICAVGCRLLSADQRSGVIVASLAQTVF